MSEQKPEHHQPRMKLDVDHVIIRPYPKIILLYPIALCALLCGIFQAFYDPASPGYDSKTHVLGMIFFIVFALNMLVFSFDFTRLKSVTIIVSVLALVFLALWLGERWPIIETLRKIVTYRKFAVSTELYFGFLIYFGVIFIFVLINTRFSYYEIKHNEILYHTGFLGEVKRYPSPNLKMTKEINDVVEFMLLRSGRIILYPASEREAIVLENVLNVNQAERHIYELLGTMAVEIDVPQHDQDHDRESRH